MFPAKRGNKDGVAITEVWVVHNITGSVVAKEIHLETSAIASLDFDVAERGEG
jgi:hypothetical protein